MIRLPVTMIWMLIWSSRALLVLFGGRRLAGAGTSLPFLPSSRRRALGATPDVERVSGS
jgi:hypothetical protein